MSIIQWICLHNNITSIKSNLISKYDEIEKKRPEAIILDLEKIGKNKVAIDEDGLKNINQQIVNINQELEKQSIKLESTVDKDISRLGLYMAMGIGFMTLFGIFTPVLVNVLSTQDLRDKQSGIDFEFKTIQSGFESTQSEFEKLKGKEKDIEQALKNADDAIGTSKTALDKADELAGFLKKQEEIIEKARAINAEVCNLILHNSIARFFNIRPILLTNAVKNKDNTIFIDHLSTIQAAFTSCRHEVHHRIKGQQFQETIREFILFLRTESLLQSTLNTKPIFNEVDLLVNALNMLFTIKEDDKDEHYGLVNEKIEQLKISIKNQHAKDKPAA